MSKLFYKLLKEQIREITASATAAKFVLECD